MTNANDLRRLRERVAKACRVLGNLELTKSTFGHVSVRVPGTDTLLIRARGPDESGIRYTAPDDVITVDFSGNKIKGRDGLDVPKEVFIHTWVYRARPDVQSVLHAHPATVMMFTICNKPLLPLFGAYDPSCLRLLTEGLSTYPSSVLICTDELGKDLASTMQDKSCQACLMRGHGITTCGASIEEATLTAIRLNDLADINYRAHLLGDPQPISEEEIRSFDNVKDGGPAASWRYYCRLVGEDY
jgi:ribulose-5-phosphate 4-epimerase/fuculose-1-phosphate aldolase